MKKKPAANTAALQDSIKKNLKELRCLHQIARISAMPEKTIDVRLQEIADVLPQAFSRSRDIWVRITNDGREFKTSNYRDTERLISANIKVQEERAGAIEIGYAGRGAKKAFSLISSQDILLIDTIAERLGSIIEHCQAQEALKESEEKFSKAFRLSPAGIIITSVEDGRIVELNDVFLRFIGLTHQQTMKLSTLDLGIWENQREREVFIRRVIEQGGVHNVEKVVALKNGGRRTVLVSADIIHLGNRQHVITVVQDITEQKQSREFLESIFNASPMAVYVMREGYFKYANERFLEITGLNREELAQVNLEGIVPEADRDVIKAAAVAGLEDAKPYPCEYRVIHKNGRVKWVMQVVAPIHYENQPALLGTIIDITERKYLERKVIEYEELDKMKGDILATVSHELRTPLAAIKGYTTMLLDYRSRLKADETMEYLISINSSADHLMTLIDNLLDSSRLDSGMLVMRKAAASITELIRTAVKTMGPRVIPRTIGLALPPSLPRVDIDKKRITQVLENLIANAARYSPPDKEIVVSAAKKRRRLEISVTDYGAVIPSWEIASIFDRMYKIERPEYSGADRMGLGLHICRRLVEAHGGLIWAESAKNTGTTIRFTLPLRRKTSRKIQSGQK